MSYRVVSYLTNSLEVKKLYGCKDKVIYAFILDYLSEALDGLNDDFDFYSNIGDQKNSQ